MTMIRPRSDVVYGICRGLPSGGVTGRVFLQISAMIKRSLNDYISHERFWKKLDAEMSQVFTKQTISKSSINMEVFYVKKMVGGKDNNY